MKKGILFCLSIATAVFFAACGDDPSSSNNANPAQENILPEESEKVEVSSSSVKVVPASSAEISVSKPTIPLYTVEKGTMVDERDCRTYKTITIGTQTWMAENLKFEYKVDGKTYGNSCNPDSCETFGRHYTWAAAMDSAVVFTNDSENCGYGVTCSPTYPVPGICPEGWHIPDSTEWVEFYKILNEDPHAMLAEDFIRSKSAIRKGLVATNASGFSALYETLSLVAGHTASGAFFWSSTEYITSRAYYWHVSESEARLDNNKICDKGTGMAVRCIKDFGTVVTPSSSCAEEPPVSSVENPVDTPVVKPPVENLLVDNRDGQTYKTVTIGSQTWMAENLNYDYRVDDRSYGSYCYSDDCKIYGRYYKWDVAQNVCPKGWHLPNKMEWEALYKAIGEDPYAMQATGYWNEATNASGFSALPGGYSFYGSSRNFGSRACFWGSSRYGSHAAYGWKLDADYANHDIHEDSDALSVRCLKNEEVSSSSVIIKSSSSSQAVKSSSSKDKGDRMFYLPTLIQACAYANLGNARFIECKSPNAIDCLQKINGCNFDAVEYCGCWESEDAYIYYRNKDKGQIR